MDIRMGKNKKINTRKSDDNEKIKSVNKTKSLKHNEGLTQ
jgi:hypothetical protein